MQYKYCLKCRLPSGRSTIAAVGNNAVVLERLKPFNDPDYWLEERISATSTAKRAGRPGK